MLQGNLPAVYDIWKDCTRYYSPNIITQRRFLRALTTFGDLQSAYRILQHMVTIAAQNSDHLRVSSKGRYQSSRLDIPVLALSQSEDIKLLLDFNLQPSQEQLATDKSSADVQLLENVQLKADVLSAGLVCIPFAYTIHHLIYSSQ